MVPIPGRGSCIDAFEAATVWVDGKETAVSRKGEMPASKTSFLQAQAACANAGKRLCRLEEWDGACRGKENRTYPYGKEFKKEACNSVYLYEDPIKAGPKPAGSMPACRSPEGVYDLSGNVWEWVDEKDRTGTLRLLRGGGYSNQDYLLGCEGGKGAFQPVGEAHQAYGFRCCKDAP